MIFLEEDKVLRGGNQATRKKANSTVEPLGRMRHQGPTAGKEAKTGSVGDSKRERREKKK